MTVPLARRVPALARYDLRRKKLPFATRTISMVVPASMGDVLAQASAKDLEQQPYWAELWPAAVGLARVLMRGPPLDGMTVLDVGCGLGLGGVAAGIKGARVVFADREAPALAFARFNAEHNGVVDFDTLAMDWNLRLPSGPYDLMLLADVTYSARNHDGLLRLIDHALAPAGVAIAADPFRAGGDAFAALAAQRLVSRQTRTDCFFAARRMPVRLWVLGRDESAVETWCARAQTHGVTAEDQPS